MALREALFLVSPLAPLYASRMSDDAPSFVRGIFAGAIHDALLFPFPAPLDERDPEETRTVRRLVDALDVFGVVSSVDASLGVRAYRTEIVDRQQELERLSDMAIELFATACVLARTQRLLEERGAGACATELDLCDLFAIEAGRRFRASRIAIQSPQDETRRAVARGVRESRGYGVTSAILSDHTATSQSQKP